MIAFEQYEQHLLNLVRRLSVSSRQDSRNEVALALDGQPARVLHTLVELDACSLAGAFFTSARLANRLVRPWKNELSSGKAKVFDPACGAGDLLLAVARQFPVKPTLGRTLRFWSDHLFGYDIHQTFVRTTKLRLILLACQRCTLHDRIPEIDDVFKGIECADCLRKRWPQNTTHVIMNPPFTLSAPARGCEWANGQVNQAGIFLERVLKKARPGSKIATILPEVLRTGARYQHWREFIERLGMIDSVDAMGNFGPIADVDVFTLHMRCCPPEDREAPHWWSPTSGLTVKDLFHVNVGPVVPHRDRKIGPRAPFFDVKSAAPWSTIRKASEFRRFKGRLFAPPFVVVRRTSSPSDKSRAIGSVIKLNSSVAVENHLLVLTPRDARIGTCMRLMRALKTTDTSAWLNKRIRCRHLTVGALGDVPITQELK